MSSDLPTQPESDADGAAAIPAAANNGAETEDRAVTPAAPADRPETKRQPLDADGRERPAFLLGFPDDPKLNELVAAFERGDFAYVRANANDVADNATDDDVSAAARDLRRRIDPDPLVTRLLLMSLALLAFLIGWVYMTR